MVEITTDVKGNIIIKVWIENIMKVEEIMATVDIVEVTEGFGNKENIIKIFKM